SLFGLNDNTALLLYSFLLSIFIYIIHTLTTEFFSLSLHDALPISHWSVFQPAERGVAAAGAGGGGARPAARLGGGGACELAQRRDRKSTRLNSSHVKISYAVFCLKKKTYYMLEVFFESETNKY